MVIYCYMAHHQGMSLTALDNVLHRDVMQRRFHARPPHSFRREPSVRGNSDASPDRSDESARAGSPTSQARRSRRSRLDRETAALRVHLHGDGRYALMITNSGGGYSRWGDFDLRDGARTRRSTRGETLSTSAI